MASYNFLDASTLADELPGGDVQIPSGGFDPANLSPESSASSEQEKLQSSQAAMGAVVFTSVLEKVVPELFGVVTWAGAKGPGGRGGSKQDIYKVVPLSESNAGPGAQKVFMQKDEVPSLGDKAPDAKKDQVVMQRKEFGWKKIYHALLGPTGNADNGGFMTEIPFTPTPMRMYTDHRVMGVIVLPGVSHISLMASTGLVAFAQRDGSYGTDEQAIVKDVLFERPYVVHDGLMVNDPSRYVPHPSGMGTPMPGEDPKGVIVYCRATNVSRERGGQKR